MIGKLRWKSALVRRIARGGAGLLLVVGVSVSPLGADMSSARAAHRSSGSLAGGNATVATAPDAPIIGVAVAGSSQATVNWTAPASQGTSPITAYRVTAYWGLGFSSTVTYNSTATSQIFVGLSNGTGYKFKVAAINASGTGPLSGYSNTVTPVLAFLPGAPTIGTATGGNQQATVTWTAPNDGGSAITGYQVVPYLGEEAQTPLNFNSPATSQVITGLTNGTPYTFTVAAINGVGTGEPSNGSNVVIPGTVPGAPTIGVATPGNTQANVSWTAPDSDGGIPITGYVVTPFIGATAQATRTFNSTLTSQVITGLTNGTTYTFKVAAINFAGTGAQSEASNSVIPAVSTVPGAPVITSVIRGNGQVTMTWTTPASNGSPITSYLVTPYVGASALPTRLFNSTATTQVITGLINGLPYTFKVAAINGLGLGAASNPSDPVTPATVPGAPTIGVATAGNAQATVTWTAPSFNGGSPITGYVVTPYLGATAMPTQTFNSTAVSQTVTGLINGAPYRFTVAAINAVGTGTPSALSNTINPAAPTVPGAPTIGTATAGNAQATVNWTAPASDGGSPITGYVVTPFVGTEPLTPVTFNTAATSQVMTGLFNDATYTFTVAATNAVGTGAPSSASNAVTPTAPTTGTVSGTVRDGANQPIKGVVVTVPGYPAATTGANGTYSVPGVAFGTFTVQAEGVCRAPVGQSVTLSGDLTVDLSLGGFVTACSVDAQVWDATTTVLPLTTSDTATAVALPFTYTHLGSARTTAYVSSNGVVNFLGLETSSANTALPNAAAPNDAIYGFWDHLKLDGSSAVLANTFGTAPNRRFVIEYRNVAIFDDPSARFSFQVVLYEDPNQRIRLQYQGITAGTAAAGTSATVGHENAAGNSAQQVSFNKGLLFDGLSVRPK